ncbi:conserved Plasmodium protein, unknown function [Plasmodium sp. DRC-Itaito]|nr:conserved Plasmodium protein, unknown function [Plasmodium sp. DRC-Itaito]
MNSNHNMLKNNFTNAHTGYPNKGMPERCKAWVDLPETRNMINSSVGKTFINIPYENYEFGSRRMNTIDTADLANKKHLCALPKIENSFTMCANKINTEQNRNKGNNNHVNLHENRSFNVQENHRFTQNNTKDVNNRNPIYNFQDANGVPSFGTQFHNKGSCSPCKYEWTRGCHLGSFCRFCHDQSHVPEGTQRVIPDPRELAITRVKPENIFTSNVSRNTNAPFVTKPESISNGKRKKRIHRKNANKGQRKEKENKIDSKKEEKKMDSKKEEEKMDSKKEEKKMNSKKEDKTDSKKEDKTDSKKKECKTNNQTKENKTNNQTKENKTNNQTKENNINNQKNKNFHKNNKNSNKMNNIANERNPQNIGNSERNRNHIRPINYNDYTTLNTWNCTHNYNPYEDDLLICYYNTFISNLVAHNEENALHRIFCIIFKRNNDFEDYECFNLYYPHSSVHHMSIYPPNMVPMWRY